MIAVRGIKGDKLSPQIISSIGYIVPKFLKSDLANTERDPAAH